MGEDMIKKSSSSLLHLYDIEVPTSKGIVTSNT
jgi:hypothetical protein